KRSVPIRGLLIRRSQRAKFAPMRAIVAFAAFCVAMIVIVLAVTWPVIVPTACLKDPNWLSACATSAQALLTIVALFVAIAIPAWQTFQAQQIQVIGTRPRLGFSWIISAHAPHIEINVRNSGLGPAIFRRYSLFVDGEEIEQNQRTLWEDAFAELN